MTVLSAENFVVRLFVVQPRTVVVQDDFEALFNPPYLAAWNLGGGTSGNSTETFHRKMMISQYFTIFTTAGYEA